MAHPQHAIPMVLPNSEVRARVRAPLIERASWSLYDFSNTIFSMNVATLYFTVWLVSDLGVSKGASVLAFVNGLGGTPLIELYLLFNAVTKNLDARGISVTRSLVGNYITSLEMAGCSITLLELDDELTGLWDAPVKTAALRWGA
jgi:dihydroxyacetone kinase